MLSDMEECRQDDILRMAATQLEGGYHMSLENTAHQEYNTDELKSDDHINHCISTVHDIFNRTGQDLLPWDYRQAPLPLQKFHEQICKVQNVDPLLMNNP